MIRPNPRDPFADDQRIAEALYHARLSAEQRAEASGLSVIQRNSTDAVITEKKDKKSGGGDDMGGMDDIDY